tara:strand:- start:542 stop:1093 length:552 start_codon:yes stop_codon:yes gene_type:complete
MKKYIFVFFFFFITIANASQLLKKNIILNLNSIDNIAFDFEQNINGKVENGTCTIQYPKKIFCRYNTSNQKILVSNGKSLVIKTLTSYYLYPLNKTPLNLILNKDFLLDKIKNLDERVIDNKFINYNFSENDNEINIFFDNDSYNLIGWQTLDIYQNLSITYLNSIIKNKKLKKNLFQLPKQN